MSVDHRHYIFIVYLSYLSPGDPAQILLNNQGVKASEEALQSTRHELGLDRPMIVQYGDG